MLRPKYRNIIPNELEEKKIKINQLIAKYMM